MIVNNLPCGGSVIPENCGPFLLYSDPSYGAGSYLGIHYYIQNSEKKITYISVPSSGSGNIYIMPIVNFNGQLTNGSGTLVDYTFEKGVAYEIKFYKSSSTYYFYLYKKVGTTWESVYSYTSTSNNWSNGLIRNISF